MIAKFAILAALVAATPASADPGNVPPGNAYGHPRVVVICTPGPEPFCRRVTVHGHGGDQHD